LLIGTIDPLLSGLSMEAARIVDPAYTVSPLANWYFMIVSTPLVTAMGWFVTERIVAPRFPDTASVDAADDADPQSQRLSPAERLGIRYALIATAALSLLLLWSALPLGSIPGAGFLRDAGTGDLLKSPFLSGVVVIIFAYGVLAGIAYGVGAGTIRNDTDVINGMGASMSTLGGYLVLVFFAAQFVAFFNWTQLRPSGR